MAKEDGKELRIAALKAAAVAKQERTAANFDKAINKLVQNNEPITFANVAREAGVSQAYLYKRPEVKERILELRKQQRQGGDKPTRSQTASEASKTVIIIRPVRKLIASSEHSVAAILSIFVISNERTKPSQLQAITVTN